VIRCMFYRISTTATGVDGLNVTVLWPIIDLILPHLTHIINCCITHSYFPALWRKSIVTAIPKCENPQLKDYRPISVLCTISKVLERVLFEQLNNSLLLYCRMSSLDPVLPCSSHNIRLMCIDVVLASVVQ
jgi:hypothetical protein